MYKLLIAEDEADERALIRFLLKEFDNKFNIMEAANGRDALDLLKNNHIDILLSDVQMPFLDGIELVRTIKEINPDIEVLFFSGFDDFVYVKTALSLKAVNYILKPVSPEEFYKSLSEIVCRLDSNKLQYVKSEQYIEAHFRDVTQETANAAMENLSMNGSTDLLLQDIETALRLKQPAQLEILVHNFLDQYADTPNLSHIYIRYICTALLQKLCSALPSLPSDELQNVAHEIYSLRHFSDIIELINHYLSLVISSFQQEQNASSYAVYQVQQYVQTHYKEDLTLNALANMVYLNPNYLSNVFAQTTGCTLSKYIKQIRMEKAQELLLNTNMKIADISQETGYPTTSYFCKTFQKIFGTTPERFRHGERGQKSTL